MSHGELGVRAPYIGVFVSPPQDAALPLPDLCWEVSGLEEDAAH